MRGLGLLTMMRFGAGCSIVGISLLTKGITAMELGRRDQELVRCGKCGQSLHPETNEGWPDDDTPEWMITRAYKRNSHQHCSVKCTRCGHYTVFIPRQP
jgi:ribosomal protein S27E